MPTEGLMFRNKAIRSLFSLKPQGPVKQGNSYFYPYGYVNQLFSTSDDNLLQFLQVPELNTIINLRARAMSMSRIEVISKTTKEPAKNQEQLIRTLRSPNWFQASREFWRQSSLYRDIYGNEFIYFL